MAMRLPGAPRSERARPDSPGPGRSRKIAIIGTAPSLWGAPWDDPSWEVWAHASAVNVIKGGWRPDLLIDIHPPHCFREERKNGYRNYYEFLQQVRIPILMQEHYKEIPSSVRFPRERIKTEWPDVPVGSMTSWMVAYALLKGVTHLGFWGIHYAHKSEYEEQRTNTEHWIGIARGFGVQIVIPKDSPLCHEPNEDYGYESHSTPEKYAARKARIAAMKAQVGLPGAIGAQKTGEPMVPLRIMRTVEDYAEAHRLRIEKDPAWVKEVATFAPEESFPQWILDMEARQREQIKNPTGALGPAPHGGVRHSVAVAQVVASEQARLATVAADAGRSGTPSIPRDAVVQPRRKIARTRPDRRVRVRDGRAAGSRTAVGRKRSAPGPTRQGKRIQAQKSRSRTKPRA